ncbi:MAG: phage shock protein operon transcriptional activator [Pseudomonadota bacterium]
MTLLNAPDLIGEAPIFLDALSHASASALLNRPLLICGERGSGKELIAERVHFLSPRWERPFVKVNCAALSEDLLDAELFGSEAGAFTGAQKRRAGRFERANGGTLFLDEIPSASQRVQEKLLRVIEYGEFERIGGQETLKTDVRTIAAANVDLLAMAARGDFRADLLDRLSFDVVVSPPLRARQQDIPILAAYFANRIAAEVDKPYPGFTPDAISKLTDYRWPGNVRELKNAAERSCYRWLSADKEGPIDSVVINPFAGTSLPLTLTENSSNLDTDYTSLPDDAASISAISQSNFPFDLRDHLNTVEKTIVADTLKHFHGSQKKAGDALGLNYNQIRGLVRKHTLS